MVSNGLVGAWALAAHRSSAWRSRALWWSTGVAEVAIFVQAVLGVVLLNVEDIEAPDLHLLYGFSAIIAVGIIYSYRQQLEGRRYLLYGFGGLFIMGLAIRAMIV